MKRVAIVVGGRPNYIKLAPVVRALDDAEDIECLLVDAGQHYSREMRSLFFDEVGLRKYDVWFNIGAGSHANHTAKAMTKMEKWLEGSKPDIVIIHGDMDYALGCALATTKLHIPVIHNEAGLRSFDRRMPEEINRILIDHIASHHFTTELSARKNLVSEGIGGSVHSVGSTLADSIKHVFGKIPKWKPIETGKPYAVVTMHRPENVDDRNTLIEKIKELARVGELLTVVVACHPRTQAKMKQVDGYSKDKIKWLGPLGYRLMLESMLEASVVITDSGGLQEETTILGIPCLTWRNNTERPITITDGTNKLITDDLLSEVRDVLECPPEVKNLPWWDGEASGRIVDAVKEIL